MKTLLLMRHAKSNLAQNLEEDRERTLSKRGVKNAARMGKLLKEKKLLPDFILTSSAVRAQETANLLIESSGFAGEMRAIDSLYMGEIDSYVQEIRMFAETMDRILVIGHNPTAEGLLQMLTGKVESLPTGAIACLNLPIKSWDAFHLDLEAELVQLWKPKSL